MEDLAITELELVTLALASLNGLIYYFWWDKPLGVKELIEIYTIDMDPPRKAVNGAERRVSIVDDMSYEMLTPRCRGDTWLLWRLRLALFREFVLLPSGDCCLRLPKSRVIFIRWSLRTAPFMVSSYPHRPSGHV